MVGSPSSSMSTTTMLECGAPPPPPPLPEAVVDVALRLNPSSFATAEEKSIIIIPSSSDKPKDSAVTCIPPRSF